MSEVRRRFDEVSRQYDEQRRKFIPCFDDFYALAATAADTPLPSPAVLDVGAGTGLLTAFLTERFPTGTYTLVDLSGQMLDRARERFAGRDGMQYIVADYLEHDFGRTYDLVVSALSIHHLDDDAKRRLYRKCFGLLNPGGVFVNADQVKGDTPYLESLHKRVWYDGIERSGLTPEEIRAGRERIALDREAGLGEQLLWLREAGFRDVGCLYRYLHFAVFMGRKPTGKAAADNDGDGMQ
ncbi:MAG: class I SAM-dependent methyltransferase [Clostridia bacterium]|nr:class I SAM-dependent methyltransferase [Clostridia bacterium]